ncbi:hypothetical protein WJX82_006561 [Trebouxia sp. C0006]
MVTLHGTFYELPGKAASWQAEESRPYPARNGVLITRSLCLVSPPKVNQHQLQKLQAAFTRRKAFEKDKQAVDQDKPALKKAGRPVEYQGDINSPALSTSERCRIKRRIVNREAARRLRERRQESLDSAQDKVGELKQRNRKLKLNLQERRTQRKELQGRVQHADSQWSQAAADYEHLQASVHSMRCSLEASLQMIEKQRTPNQPLFSGQAPFLSPTRPHPRDRVQGIEGLPLEVARHSPAESALSHEGLQASYLSSCAPSFVARESLGTPPHWTKVQLEGALRSGTYSSTKAAEKLPQVATTPI